MREAGPGHRPDFAIIVFVLVLGGARQAQVVGERIGRGLKSR